MRFARVAGVDESITEEYIYIILFGDKKTFK
ncbi:hypothetical protein BCE_2644 [Bacillus cereus ATCC 10987]|jgi:hypothetical protein|uniref:Uncharacterized protein n=1 Tax=Bacillus cereus (strain ATCC 10987 / NRS 248) TaxID=222523 RepID=Q737K4_BACC1|nr:hypothetical protein BCE_2644 [Bacillus cereus ATCC 10987]